MLVNIQLAFGQEVLWRIWNNPDLIKNTQQKTHNLFWPDENSIEQCCAAHIVLGC